MNQRSLWVPATLTAVATTITAVSTSMKNDVPLLRDVSVGILVVVLLVVNLTVGLLVVKMSQSVEHSWKRGSSDAKRMQELDASYPIGNTGLHIWLRDFNAVRWNQRFSRQIHTLEDSWQQVAPFKNRKLRKKFSELHATVAEFSEWLGGSFPHRDNPEIAEFVSAAKDGVSLDAHEREKRKGQDLAHRIYELRQEIRDLAVREGFVE